MGGLLQPVHLFFILMIVLILLGPGKLPELGQRMGRSIADLRGQLSGFRRVLFMAKGVNPEIGRDVGDMLPDEDAHHHETWYRILVAILIGNTVYILLSPSLPAAARLDAIASSGLPALVDIWSCSVVFGLLVFMRSARKQNGRPR